MTQTPGWYFCLKCGAELSADARFCPICGHPVGGTRTRSQSRDSLVEVGGEQLPLASVGKRLGALIVDGLVFGAVIYGLFIVIFVVVIAVSIDETTGEPDISISSGAFTTIMLVSVIATTLLSWALDTFGWSPGKAATGIRAVRLDGRRPGLVHGLVRYSMRAVGLLPLGLGYFWAIWDDRNQTWHDKLARTVVVRTRLLEDRFPDRRPEPLVTETAVWWLASLGALILTASLAWNVWWVGQFDSDLFDPTQFDPERFEEDRRISDAPDSLEALLVHLKD